MYRIFELFKLLVDVPQPVIFSMFQVSGELSNNGQPMRRFMQTFVLSPLTPQKYYVHNDIFRYQVRFKSSLFFWCYSV